MKREVFRAEASGIDAIPRYCDEVTVGCSDVAGIVEAVARTSERLRGEHAELQATIGALEAEQRQVTDASKRGCCRRKRSSGCCGVAT
jgi:methyl-accepting chemotaxis protein